jgi:superfamily II DNA or RNA helicase
LLHQWDEEIRKDLGDLDAAILLAGSDVAEWRPYVRAFTAPEGDPRVVIAVAATASSADFLKRVYQGKHLLVVGDEVHRMGAGKISQALRIEAGPTLGLSATPERAGDPDGTARIIDFFGPVLQPEFTLADAIAAGRLCRYEYYVHLVSLTAEEEDRWNDLTHQIRRLSARTRGDEGPADFTRLDPYLKMLLIQRARIARSASAKPPLAADVVASNIGVGQHWLVYCDDTTQLDLVRRHLSDRGIESMPYYSAMVSDHRATLDRFTRDGGVLVSIKCLDEGVDIPAVSHAVIAASSRNPREFIQRRGRVLRTHPGKRFAVIHDLLVRPPEPSSDDYRSLVLGELARAHEFALHAVNESGRLQLKALAVEWDLDPDALLGGVEDDLEEAA